VRLLLETHIDPAVGAELATLVPGIEIEFQQRWRGGTLRKAGDDELLTVAREDGYIFVTCDVTTIPPLLAQRYERGESSPGVILVSSRSFRQNDVAGIARALAALWQQHRREEWAGQVVYLTAPSQ
jgi:predicted nuclease of predicted toxin-antitoxin system